jgi:hypothetical protein
MFNIDKDGYFFTAIIRSPSAAISFTFTISYELLHPPLPTLHSGHPPSLTATAQPTPAWGCAVRAVRRPGWHIGFALHPHPRSQSNWPILNGCNFLESSRCFFWSSYTPPIAGCIAARPRSGGSWEGPGNLPYAVIFCFFFL